MSSEMIAFWLKKFYYIIYHDVIKNQFGMYSFFVKDGEVKNLFANKLNEKMRVLTQKNVHNVIKEVSWFLGILVLFNNDWSIADRLVSHWLLYTAVKYCYYLRNNNFC